MTYIVTWRLETPSHPGVTHLSNSPDVRVHVHRAERALAPLASGSAKWEYGQEDADDAVVVAPGLSLELAGGVSHEMYEIDRLRFSKLPWPARLCARLRGSFRGQEQPAQVLGPSGSEGLTSEAATIYIARLSVDPPSSTTTTVSIEAQLDTYAHGYLDEASTVSAPHHVQASAVVYDDSRETGRSVSTEPFGYPPHAAHLATTARYNATIPAGGDFVIGRVTTSMTHELQGGGVAFIATAAITFQVS